MSKAIIEKIKWAILSVVKVLVTAGSTREHIDSVRFISSGSSGKQGYALAECMGKLGWDVKLVSCTVNMKPKRDLYEVIYVDTSANMLDTCLSLLPVDVAIFTAAVTDWIPHTHDKKLKKNSINRIDLLHSPDIVKCVCLNENRPKLVVGFCLESENLIESAKSKLVYKGCDWIVANNQYIRDHEPVMGNDYNDISIITESSVKSFGIMTKLRAAEVIVEEIIDYLGSLPIR